MLPTLSYLYANRDNPVFDVRRTPSNVGAIPEYFRTEYPVLRSLCPTHSCAAVGLRAEYLTGSHHLDETPCANSPFSRLRDAGGKVLSYRLRYASEYFDACRGGAEPASLSFARPSGIK